MKNVLVIQPVVKKYRVAFFEMLQATLKRKNIILRIAYSQPNVVEKKKADNCDLDGELGVKVKGYWFFGNRILFQPLMREVAKADLVILEHANKYLLHYFLYALALLRIKKIAFWGHGRNLQSSKNRISEKIKLKTLNIADWWFAYTEGVRNYLMSKGVPSKKITVVQNSIDIEQLKHELSLVDCREVFGIRQQLTIGRESPVGLFCGSLHKNKALSFLFQAAQLIRQKIPDFHLLIIGAGPEDYCVQDAAARYQWIHYLGPKFGAERAVYFKMADLFLMPGLVGLAVLDAFAAGLPVITTDVPFHSPEIEYLESEVNGYMVKHDPEVYADKIIFTLTNQELLITLKQGALASSERCSLDTMVANFRQGVMACLSK